MTWTPSTDTITAGYAINLSVDGVHWVSGPPWAYGRLKGETGVHRVCHISEFDAERKKQTSFAAVEAIPLRAETKIEVKEAEIEMETFCSGGPGGQNVNKVASAVRIRHVPTGTIVKCQSQRSQLQNKAKAMEILYARLRKREEDLRAGGRGPRMEAAFGHQIRSYVMEPYQLVKDHRTGHTTSDARGMLDGELLDGFVEALLKRENVKRGI